MIYAAGTLILSSNKPYVHIKSAESSIESIDYEIFINSKCTPSLNVLFEPEMVDLDYRIIELMVLIEYWALD